MDEKRFGLSSEAVEDLTHTEEEAISIAKSRAVETGQTQHVIMLVAVASPPGTEAAIVKYIKGEYRKDGSLE